MHIIENDLRDFSLPLFPSYLNLPYPPSHRPQVNNVRLAAGRPSLGWLNPLIYANSACFNDVSDGSVNNCYAKSEGFAALSGWDAATGMGSPNYACLAAL